MISLAFFRYILYNRLVYFGESYDSTDRVIKMLGKYFRVRITKPIHSRSEQQGFEYLLNFGQVEGGNRFKNSSIRGAFIMGISKPVRSFDGRVIAVVKFDDSEDKYIVLAPKSTRFIETQIRKGIGFAFFGTPYKLECLYESSCGAVVFRTINGEIRYLLIKNKRSAHWGFPKGHIEKDETAQQTAMREVLEETGIHIDIIPDFSLKSEYTIQGKVEKSVIIFMARTNDVQTKIQREEIDDYIWLSFNKALELLKFENDRSILRRGNEYLLEKGIISAPPL